jgi:hypothetical protein
MATPEIFLISWNGSRCLQKFSNLFCR